MPRGHKKSSNLIESESMSPSSLESAAPVVVGYRTTEDRWARMMGVRFLIPAGTEAETVPQQWIDLGITYEPMWSTNGADVH